MTQDKISRRTFIKNASVAGAGVALGATAFSARSYGRILGANDRVNFAIAGLHGRGQSLLEAISKSENAMVSHICDVDQREIDKFSQLMVEMTATTPEVIKDFRKLVKVKDIDAIAIATPEHWHTPMAIMGLQAGKHIYVEKPCSHNPHEGELLVEAQQKYGLLVQMGNQQRSSDHSIQAIQRIHDGLIGKVYMGKAWYSATRNSIGVGTVVPVPDYLDWELWQGPAPRQPYKSNVHPYNWHWFWHWGTGETLNNGTHEVDICRWALGVGLPNRITAAGGRYHFKDDWEFYDTLVTNFEYDDKLITWEGKSCQGMKYFNGGRGATIHGTEGTVLIDRGGYKLYSRENELLEEVKTEKPEESMGVVGGGFMTAAHMQNLINGIRVGEKLHSPIEEGNISVTMLQLSNIAWKTSRTLNLDPKNGHIKKNKKAMKMWSREYEKGWEPRMW